MRRDDRKLPKIVSRKEWRAARTAMAKDEADAARVRNAIVVRWAGMSMVEMVKRHVFEGRDGTVGLIDLFEERSLLLVYHFWFQPGEQPCEGCSLWTSDLGDLGGHFKNLHDHDASLIFVSRASAAEIEEVKKQRGWTMPWYSIVGDAFDVETGYKGWAQVSVLVRDGDKAFLTNVVSFDDLKSIGNHWTLLDRTPFGSGD